MNADRFDFSSIGETVFSATIKKVRGAEDDQKRLKLSGYYEI
jgi:hypothetical protein